MFERAFGAGLQGRDSVQVRLRNGRPKCLQGEFICGPVLSGLKGESQNQSRRSKANPKFIRSDRVSTLLD